jgi:NADH-quinone oxidoreductase subunit N
VVGAFYYLRIVKIMYFDEPAKAFDQAGIAARVVLALSTALVIFYAIAPAPLTDAAMAAAKSLF